MERSRSALRFCIVCASLMPVGFCDRCDDAGGDKFQPGGERQASAIHVEPGAARSFEPAEFHPFAGGLRCFKAEANEPGGQSAKVYLAGAPIDFVNE